MAATQGDDEIATATRHMQRAFRDLNDLLRLNLRNTYQNLKLHGGLIQQKCGKCHAPALEFEVIRFKCKTAEQQRGQQPHCLCMECLEDCIERFKGFAEDRENAPLRAIGTLLKDTPLAGQAVVCCPCCSTPFVLREATSAAGIMVNGSRKEYEVNEAIELEHHVQWYYENQERGYVQQFQPSQLTMCGGGRPPKSDGQGHPYQEEIFVDGKMGDHFIVEPWSFAQDSESGSMGWKYASSWTKIESQPLVEASLTTLVRRRKKQRVVIRVTPAKLTEWKTAMLRPLDAVDDNEAVVREGGSMVVSEGSPRSARTARSGHGSIAFAGGRVPTHRSYPAAAGSSSFDVAASESSITAPPATTTVAATQPAAQQPVQPIRASGGAVDPPPANPTTSEAAPAPSQPAPHAAAASTTAEPAASAAATAAPPAATVAVADTPKPPPRDDESTPLLAPPPTAAAPAATDPAA